MDNVASGDEYVPFQIGRFATAEERAEAGDAADSGPGTVENIRTGDARVGVQVDEWEGDIDIAM